jgi:CRP-like cAMP-binding protein
MQPRKLRQGQVLFNKGDPADQLYYLVDGAIELVELGLSLPTGRLFGEIAFFAPDRRRTATARCVSACTVLTISESTFTQLYYQNPDFGFEVVRLIAGRLSGDVQRLEQALERSRDSAGG